MDWILLVIFTLSNITANKKGKIGFEQINRKYMVSIVNIHCVC